MKRVAQRSIAMVVIWAICLGMMPPSLAFATASTVHQNASTVTNEVNQQWEWVQIYAAGAFDYQRDYVKRDLRNAPELWSRLANPASAFGPSNPTNGTQYGDGLFTGVGLFVDGISYRFGHGVGDYRRIYRQPNRDLPDFTITEVTWDIRWHFRGARLYLLNVEFADGTVAERYYVGDIFNRVYSERDNNNTVGGYMADGFSVDSEVVGGIFRISIWFADNIVSAEAVRLEDFTGEIHNWSTERNGDPVTNIGPNPRRTFTRYCSGFCVDAISAWYRRPVGNGGDGLIFTLLTDIPNGRILDNRLGINYLATPSQGAFITNVSYSVNGGEPRAIYTVGGNYELGWNLIRLDLGANNIVFTATDSNGATTFYAVNATLYNIFGIQTPNIELESIEFFPDQSSTWSSTDRLTVFAQRNITIEQMRDAIAPIGGTVIGYIRLIGEFTIQVPQNTRDGLLDLADYLMASYPHIFEYVTLYTGFVVEPQTFTETLQNSQNELLGDDNLEFLAFPDCLFAMVGYIDDFVCSCSGISVVGRCDINNSINLSDFSHHFWFYNCIQALQTEKNSFCSMGTVYSQLNIYDVYFSALPHHRYTHNGLQNFRQEEGNTESAFCYMDTVCDELGTNNFILPLVTEISVLSQTSPTDDSWWGDQEWALTAINVPEVWRRHGDIIQPIGIGIVDDGVNRQHQDLLLLEENVRTRRGKLNHGSHVIGTIGSIHGGDNDLGVTGIVNARRQDLFSYDAFWIFNVGGREIELATNNSIRDGLVWNVFRGARVVNFSIGVRDTRQGNLGQFMTIDGAYDRAIQRLLETHIYFDLDHPLDFLIVHSAGNCVRNARYNGVWAVVEQSNLREHIITVGAVDSEFQMANFTNYGSRIDVVAPGVDIFSTLAYARENAWWRPDDVGEGNAAYGFMSGTSMAAPHVAGVLGLILGVRPDLTGPEARQVLIDSARVSSIIHDRMVTEHRDTVSASYQDAQYYMLCALTAVNMVLGYSLIRIDVQMAPDQNGNIHDTNFFLWQDGEVIAAGRSDELGQATLISDNVRFEEEDTLDLMLEVRPLMLPRRNITVTVTPNEITHVTAHFGADITDAFECQYFLEHVRSLLEIDENDPIICHQVGGITELTVGYWIDEPGNPDGLMDIAAFNIDDWFNDRFEDWFGNEFGVSEMLMSIEPFNDDEIPYSRISNLAGIEYFTSLERLHVYNLNWLNSTVDLSSNQHLETLVLWNNSLAEIDLSANRNLQELTVSSWAFTGIDLSGNENLRELNLLVDSLTNLNLSNNPYLESLSISNSQLTGLDLSNNSYLRNVYLRGNNQLNRLDFTDNYYLESLTLRNEWFGSPTSIDLSNNQHLRELEIYAEMNSLDLSGNPKLQEFRIRSSSLLVLDVSNNLDLRVLYVIMNQLQHLNLSNNRYLQELYIEWSQLADIDLSNNQALQYLGMASWYLPSLDLSHNRELRYLNVDARLLTSLDLSNNPALQQFYISRSAITTLDFSNNRELQTVDILLNPLTSINLLHNRELRTLRISNSQLSSIDLFGNPNLESLSIRFSQLTSISVANNRNLRTIDLRNNRLNLIIGLSNIPGLEGFSADSNQLTSINVFSNPALQGLGVQGNQLTNINLSNNTELVSLSLHGNRLTSLDLSNNPNLRWLTAGQNQLASVNLANNRELEQIGIANNNLRSLDISNLSALWLLTVNSNLMTSPEDVIGWRNTLLYEPDTLFFRFSPQRARTGFSANELGELFCNDYYDEYMHYAYTENHLAYS